MSVTPTNLIDDLRLLEAPRPLPLGWWVAILFVLGLLGFVVWRRSRGPKVFAPTPEMIAEAQEDALEELKKLHALISVPNSRPYAIQVSGVVRRYIERRFGIRAPKRSTEEFLLETQSSALIDERHRRHLGKFLACCDFLKFARAIAELAELEMIHEAAVTFVMDTQPESELKAIQPAASAANPAPAEPARKEGAL